MLAEKASSRRKAKRMPRGNSALICRTKSLDTNHKGLQERKAPCAYHKGKEIGACATSSTHWFRKA